MVNLIIVSGRSGAGKSICLHALEDLGYYCVDNIPVVLLVQLIEISKNHHPQIAVGIDARNSAEQLQQFDQVYQALRQLAQDVKIVYTDADDETLIKRFSETRRKHPLTSSSVPLREALELETQTLSSLVQHADISIDTSYLKTPELKKLLISRLDRTQMMSPSILILSFGFKYGIPRDADFVFDVRCLPNPYWNQNMHSLTGHDLAVQEFLKQHNLTNELVDDLGKYLQKWIAPFCNGQRSYLNIAIGCTGGQHRSVYVAEQIFQKLKTEFENLQIRHRELS